MPNDPHLTDGECAETTFHRLIIVRDVWLPGDKRWMKEYVGRNLPGELIAPEEQIVSDHCLQRITAKAPKELLCMVDSTQEHASRP